MCVFFLVFVVDVVVVEKWKEVKRINEKKKYSEP